MTVSLTARRYDVISRALPIAIAAPWNYVSCYVVASTNRHGGVEPSPPYRSSTQYRLAINTSFFNSEIKEEQDYADYKYVYDSYIYLITLSTLSHLYMLKGFKPKDHSPVLPLHRHEQVCRCLY